MRLRKLFTGLLIYLAPATTVLVAYSAYHDTLFKQPACTANCGFTLPAERKDIRRMLDLIDELAQHKADLANNARRIADLDFLSLLVRFNAFGNDYNLISRYGDGNLHHRWARLNAEFNAKISDYLNRYLLSDYFSNDLSALIDLPNQATQAPFAASLANGSLIGQALARDILPAENNYWVTPSNLRMGGAGFDPSNPTSPNLPVSTIPLPGAVYFMMSATLLFAGFRYKRAR